MPPRLNLTPEQFEQRVREQTRLRVKRYREKRNATPINEGSVTASLDAHTNGHALAHGSFPLVTSSPTEKRDDEGTSDAERVRRILEPVRGYVHNEGHLADLAEKFPEVDLVLEARGMARWVNDTRRGKGCTEAFMTNWVKKAAAKGTARAEPRSVLGRVLQQIANDPVAGPSTWGRQ